MTLVTVDLNLKKEKKVKPDDKQMSVFVSPSGEGSVMAMDSAYDVDDLSLIHISEPTRPY